MSNYATEDALHAIFTRMREDSIQRIMDVRRRLDYASVSSGVERCCILDQELRDQINSELALLSDTDRTFIDQQACSKDPAA